MDKITQETAKEVAICYREIKQCNNVISTIEDEIIEQGNKPKIKNSFDKKKELFSLNIRMEKGVKEIEAPPKLAKKLAKQTKKGYKKQLKKLKIKLLEELGIREHEASKKNISEWLALRIYHQYNKIEDAKKTKETVVENMEKNNAKELTLEHNMTFSNTKIAIPLSYSENAASIHGLPADLSVQILDNYIKKQETDLDQYMEMATKKLTKKEQ